MRHGDLFAGGFLAVIPARGGSKSIPRKNVKLFLGRPLMAWTVEVARKSAIFEHIVLSTDDEDIAELGRSLGAEVPFLRPASLAEDTVPTGPVVQHAVRWLAEHDGWMPDWLMVLEPTAPGRRPFHLRAAASLLTDGADSVASVSIVPHHYRPGKVLRLDADGTMTGINGTPLDRMIHRRQELPVCYALNGLVFACRTALVLQEPPTLWGRRVLAYVVDPKFAVDLDTAEDWVPAEARVRQLLEDAP